jgi:hypothetical protein
VFWADKLQLHQCKHHSVAQITIWAKQIHLQKPDQVCISILQLSLIRQHLHAPDGWIELQCSSCFNLGVLSSFAAKVLGVFFCTLIRSRVMPVQQGALQPWTESGAQGLGFGRSGVLGSAGHYTWIESGAQSPGSTLGSHGVIDTPFYSKLLRACTSPGQASNLNLATRAQTYAHIRLHPLNSHPRWDTT